MPKVIFTFLIVTTLLNVAKAQTTWQYVDAKLAEPGFEMNTEGYYAPVDIIKSTNAAELRFYCGGEHYTSMLIITYTGKKFNAAFYSRKKDLVRNLVSPLNKDAVIKPFKKVSINNVKIDSVFFELVNHRVFNLPDQKTIKEIPSSLVYRISYKLNNTINEYTFSDPEQLLKDHPGVEVFKYYNQVFSVLTNLVKDVYPRLQE
ncbi:hypothetical protein GCM10023149_26820 [Mucilaginibacter gynuensis]|uniref:DUF4468 domain-containing protein n=1 Tax=Mucilaginibacter gynuensis TaxID=1302236 RepID=A0ABP8GIK4_9SPHI